jgi:hypothetical protein
MGSFKSKIKNQKAKIKNDERAASVLPGRHVLQSTRACLAVAFIFDF